MENHLVIYLYTFSVASVDNTVNVLFLELDLDNNKQSIQIHYMNGYEDGYFKLDIYLSRVEVVIIMSKFKGSMSNFSISIKDIPSDHWSYKNIVYDIIDGYNDGTFKPNQYIGSKV